MKKLYTTIGLLCAIFTFSQNGTLDPTFNLNGKVTTDFNANSDDNATALALQTDGKIIVVGSSDNDFAVARYNIDGSLDNTFGTNGKVVTPVGIANDFATGVILQLDGKILVSGQCFVAGNEKYGLVRYNIDGTLDTSFDLDGKVITSIGNYLNRAYGLAIQPDGKIIVAGDSYNNFLRYDITLARYNTNGSLDTTFDNDGISTISFGPNGAIGYSIALLNDGKILVAGQTTNNTIGADFVLIRCTSSGALDTTFGNLGKSIVDFGTGTDVAKSLAVQTDGKIIVAGSIGASAPISYSQEFAIMRCNADGSLDTSFSGDGKIIIDASLLINYNDEARSVAVQTNGKILVAGYSDNGNDYDFTILRYNINGTLDTTFDSDGIVKTPIGINTYDFLSNILIQNDGKILAVGSSSSNFALVRYSNSNLKTNSFLSNYFSISPNPTNNFLNITTQEIINTIKIIDITGRNTNITNFENNKIDVSNLQNGIYFLEITTENGLQTQKFIKI